MSARPSAPALFDLPDLSETGKLQSDTSIVPAWIVRICFGGGALKEVYTDADLRILYGAGSNRFESAVLYIMSRASNGSSGLPIR